MSLTRRGLLVAAGAALSSWGVASWLGGPVELIAQDDAPADAGSVPRPEWSEGDNWTVETVTRRVQVRESEAVREPARIRWRFEVAKIEPVGGRDCYRIDIQCLAKGRIRPASTVWCDKETLMLQQFQTQLASNGQYRKIQESYTAVDGQTAPVVVPINALPLSLPAFIPKGSKASGEFIYTSQTAPAGSKDAGLIRFSHAVSQKVGKPKSKSLQSYQKGLSKALVVEEMTEVELASPHEKVTQLWKSGSPWPVYSDNGRTQAWLVDDED